MLGVLSVQTAPAEVIGSRLPTKARRFRMALLGSSAKVSESSFDQRMLLDPICGVRGLTLSSISKIEPPFGQISQMRLVVRVVQVIVSLAHGVSSPTRDAPPCPPNDVARWSFQSDLRGSAVAEDRENSGHRVPSAPPRRALCTMRAFWA